MLLVGGQKLLRAGQLIVRTIQMVAQQQQKRLVAHGGAGTVDGVTKALLVALRHKGYALAQVQDPLGVGLQSRRQFLVEFWRQGLLEQRAERLQVLRLDDEDDLFEAGCHDLLDQHQDGRLGQAIAVHYREELFFGGLGGREQPRAQSGGGDDGFAHDGQGPWHPGRALGRHRGVRHRIGGA